MSASARSPRPDWSVIKGLANAKFAANVRLQISIKEKIAALEEELAQVKTEGVKMLIKADVKTVDFEGRPVTLMESHSTRLDKKKFYRLGGEQAMEWYEKSLVKTPFTTMLIGKPSAEGEEE